MDLSVRDGASFYVRGTKMCGFYVRCDILRIRALYIGTASKFGSSDKYENTKKKWLWILLLLLLPVYVGV